MYLLLVCKNYYNLFFKTLVKNAVILFLYTKDFGDFCPFQQLVVKQSCPIHKIQIIQGLHRCVYASSNKIHFIKLNIQLLNILLSSLKINNK